MNPTIGQYVHILFLNKTSAEGFVYQWSDEKAVLSSESGESFLIINNPSRDIMTIKLWVKNNKKDNEEKLKELRDSIRKRVLKNVGNGNSSDIELPESEKPDSLTDLVELRKQALALEKEEFARKAVSHEMTQVGSVGNYVFPNFSKMQRPILNPSEENSGEDVEHYSELSKMFKNKDENNR